MKMEGKYLASIYGMLLAGIIATVVTVMVFTPGTPDHFFEHTASAVKSSLPSTPALPLFSDETVNSGILFSHRHGSTRLGGLDDTLGGGACAFDYDNDGWLDIFLVGGTGQTRHFGRRQWWQSNDGSRLYRNIGQAKFVDVTEEAGLNLSGIATMGCNHADLDNDGDQDLIVTAIGKILLYENNGDGKFTDISSQAGITDSSWSTSATFADFDQDGLLDIYVANYVQFDKKARLLETDAGFSPNMPPLFDVTLFDAQPNYLYRNLGNLKFEEIAARAGVDDKGGRTLSALWIDVDEDRFPDLLLGNDKNTPSRIFINNRDGSFSAAGEQYGINNNVGFQSLISADMNNDGRNEIVAGTPAGQLIKIFTHKESHAHYFLEHARQLGLSDARDSIYSTWSAGVRDFNLDGFPDLMSFNGTRTPDADAPRISTGQKKKLWLNYRGTLIDVSKSAGMALSDNISARGAAFGDFDNDGDVDVIVVHNNNPAQLLINNAPKHHWLGLLLNASSGNMDAIGARIILTTPSGKQYREINAESGFMSGHDRRIQFGLGDESNINSLEIIWPDGSSERHTELSGNRYYLIRQDEPAMLMETNTEYSAEEDNTLWPLFGRENMAFQLTLAEWLIESNLYDDAADHISMLAERADADTFRKLINLLVQLPPTHKALPIIAKGMNASKHDIRISSIRALQKYESEETIYWLLRAFNDPVPEVRIAVAETFEHLFRKEEAMINKKWLAVPPLISLLADSLPEVRATAARALSESEAFRAVEPLIGRLADSSDIVRTQALRALGMLRELQAAPKIVSTSLTPDATPLVKAHALIALKRLGTEEALRFIDHYLPVHSDALSMESAELLAHLIIEKDGTVFTHASVIQPLLKWLQQQNRNCSAKEIGSLTLVIKAIGQTPPRNSEAALRPFTKSKHPDIRLAAFQALLSSDKSRSISLFNEALSDSSEEVRGMALSSAIEYNAAPSVAILLKLMRKISFADNAALLLQNHLNSDGAKELTKLLLNQEMPIEVRKSAAFALTGHKTNNTTDSLKGIVFDSREPLALRIYALNALATPSNELGELNKLVHLRHDPLNRHVLRILATAKNQYAEKLLWNIFNNAKESEDERIFAAMTLHELFPHKTIHAFNGNRP